MPEQTLGFNIEIKGTDSLSSKLSSLNSEINRLVSRIEALNKVQGTSGKEMSALKTQLQAATKEYKKLNKEADPSAFKKLGNGINSIADGLKTASTGWSLMSKTINISTNITKIATRAQRLFNVALSRNPIGVVVGLLVAAVAAYMAFKDGVDDATVSQEELNEAVEKGSKKAEDSIKKKKESSSEEIRILEENFRVKKLTTKDEEKLDQELAEKKLELLKKKKSESDEEIKILEKQAEKEKKILEEKLDTAETMANAMPSGSVKAGTSNSDSIAKAKEDVKRIEKELALSTVSTETELALLGSYSEGLGKEIITADINVTEAILNNTEKQKIAHKERTEELGRARERLKDINIQLIEDDLERSEAAIETKFQREIDAITGYSQTEIDLRKSLEDLKEKELAENRATHQGTKEAEEKKAAEERIKIEQEVTAKIKEENTKLSNAGKTARQIEIDNIKAQFEKKKALLLSGTPEQVKLAEDLENQKNDAIEGINKKFDDEEITRKAGVQSMITDAEIANMKEGVDKKKAILEKAYQDDLAALRKQLEDKAITEEEFDILAKEKKTENDNAQAEVDAEKETKNFENNNAKAQFALEQAKQAVSLYSDFKQQEDDKQLAKIDKNTKEEVKILQSKLDAGIISQKQFDTQKGALEDKAAIETAKIKKKAFIRQKIASIIEAGIAATLGVLKASPNVPLQIATGIFGAAQVALIAAKPVPEFQKGGLVDGPSHEQGGVQMLHKSGTHIGEMEGNEYIISAQRTREIGVDKLDALNFNGVSPSINGFFASGGQVPTFNSSSSSANALSSQFNMEKLSEMISTQMQDAIVRTPVINNATDTFSVAAEVINTENELSFGQ